MFTSENKVTNESREMEWTREKTLELLREYQARTVLWDWNARGYRDRAKRKRAIQELAELLGCNTLEVEKKITNLKCQYSREVHKIQSSRENAAAPDDVYVSKWFAYKAMQFLQFGSRRYSSRKKKSEEKPEEEYIVSELDPESIRYYDETNTSTASCDASPRDDHEESNSSEVKNVAEPWSSALLDESLAPPQDGEKVEVSPTERKRARDEFVKFGESIAAQLAEIPDSYSRSVAKLKINQILFEAEIGVYAQTRERVDVDLETSQPAGRYVASLVGLHDCRDLRHDAILTYETADPNGDVIRGTEEQLDLPEAVQGHNCEALGAGTLCALDAEGPDAAEAENPDETHFVPFDLVSYVDIEDKMSDYRFNLYGFPFYPAYLTVDPGGAKIPQINGMTFKYPSSPILSQPEAVADDVVCSVDYKSRECGERPDFCECLQVLQLPGHRTVEVVLINEGAGGNRSYVFHLHGYSATVLGVESFDKPLTKSRVVALSQRGLLKRNFRSPVKRDNVVVPNRGYAVVRIFTDNFGYWLWESRTTGATPVTSGPGMQFLVLVGTRESLPTVPIDFPACGNLKGPDLIFNDE